MANSNFTPLEGAYQNAVERQTAYAVSTMDLYKSSLVPTPITPLSDYTAAVADYDTYAPITMTAWYDPILAPVSGYVISSPAMQFETGGTDPATPNVIGGFFMQDAGGVLRLAGIFDPPLPMQVAHQGIPLQVFSLFGTGG